MALPENIQTAIAADVQDMIQWSCLLNFFSTHQSELSLPEKITIYEKCEDFRIFWNSDFSTVVEVVSNSGRITNQTRTRPSLNIDKNDIFPNQIYSDKELLDYFQTIKTQLLDYNKHLTRESDRDTDLFGEAPALAI